MRILIIIGLIAYIWLLLDRIEILEAEYINLQIECNKKTTSSF
jgi:hypothetical protein